MNKKKAILLFTILFISVNFSYSQNKRIDSLLNKLKVASTDTEKIKLLKGICEFYKNNSLEKGFLYADSLYQLSEKIDDNEVKTRALSYKGIFNSNYHEGINDLRKAIYLDSILGLSNDLCRDKLNLATLLHITNQTEKAKVTLQEVIAFAEKNELYDLLLKGTYNLSKFYFRDANYDLGLKFCENSLKYFENTDDFDTQTRIYALISKIYSHLKNHTKSLEYGLRGQDMIELHSGVGLISQATVYETISEAHFNLKNEEKGFRYYKKAVDISRKAFSYEGLVNPLWIISTHISISNTKNKKLLNRVYQDAQEIKNISKEINDHQTYYSIQMILANIEFGSNNLTKSKSLAQQIIDSSYSKNQKVDIETTQQAYYLIEKINVKNKDFKNAYANTIQRYKIRDSLYDNKYHNQLSSLDVKYQTEKKEKENLQLKADKAEQAELLAKESKRKWQLGAGLLTALLTLVLFAFYYRRNKKQKEVIESLQKELHHRIKNNLSIIDTFIEVAKEEFDDQKFSLKLTELQNRIDSINEVHQQLYKNKDVTNLNLKNYIDTLSSNVSNSFSNNKVVIEKEVESNLNLNADKSFPVGLIINEFLTNSYKYAFGDDGGKVKIKIKKTDNKYNLTLSDNGRGLPQDFDIKTSESFGLRIIKLLAEQLNGSFELNNINGVVLNISFPK